MQDVNGFDEREIERAITRAVPFLRAMSTVPRLREAMSIRGYDAETHDAGWQMLLTLSGYNAPAPRPAPDLPQTQAVAEIDAWDGPTIQMIRATCARFVDQGAYLLAGVEASRGYGAVTNAQVILDRVVALRDGTDPTRAAMRERDRLCVQALADRNIITKESERHLRHLIANATGIAPTVGDDGLDAWRKTRQEVALKLKVWLEDWRGMARAIFTRRDDQIRLGLARRRSPSSTDAEVDVDEPVDADVTTPVNPA